MAIKEGGNLNKGKDINSEYTILVGMQADLFELQRQIDEINGVSVGGDSEFTQSSISRLDQSNFELTMSVSNASNVETVEVVFSEYSGAEPIPMELVLSGGSESEDGTKTFSMSTLTFDDPDAATDEVYIIVADAKSESGESVYSQEIEITVSGIQ